MNALLLAVVLAAPLPDTAAPKSVYELPRDAFIAQAKNDLDSLKTLSGQLHRTLTRVEENRPLFAVAKKDPYTAEQKQTVLSTWGALFSYFSTIEQLRQRYWDFVKLAPNDPRHPWGYLVTHTALTALLADGLRFADLTQGNRQLEILFDEANPEYGVTKGSYAQFKAKAIHVSTSTQLLTGEAWAAAAQRELTEQKAQGEALVTWAWEEIKTDTRIAKERLNKKGLGLFLKNAEDIVKDQSAAAVFPVQKSFAEWAGDTRVARVGKPLLTAEQCAALPPRLQPGDIVVVRQNWFLSNIGLPGFWPHAELYGGTPKDMADFFDADPEVLKWVQTLPEKTATFTVMMAKRFPEKWKLYAGKDLQGHAPIRVIESISEGVSFTAIEHAFGVDYLAVMRPRLSKVEKAKALMRAFEYQGRPYDFDFDFLSDSTLVCTELVYKSYAPSAEQTGLKMPLIDVAGRRTLPANEIVKLFDAEYDTPNRQLDFVLFFDGQEKAGICKEDDVKAFRKSHERLKWDVVQK